MRGRMDQHSAPRPIWLVGSVQPLDRAQDRLSARRQPRAAVAGRQLFERDELALDQRVQVVAVECGGIGRVLDQQEHGEFVRTQHGRFSGESGRRRDDGADGICLECRRARPQPPGSSRARSRRTADKSTLGIFDGDRDVHFVADGALILGARPVPRVRNAR
ncbi:protein of unknown function [Burkholderia multivorans]